MELRRISVGPRGLNQTRLPVKLMLHWPCGVYTNEMRKRVPSWRGSARSARHWHICPDEHV
eukprot:11234691-Alexandrium_andersonii.AAC.1